MKKKEKCTNPSHAGQRVGIGMVWHYMHEGFGCVRELSLKHCNWHPWEDKQNINLSRSTGQANLNHYSINSRRSPFHDQVKEVGNSCQCFVAIYSLECCHLRIENGKTLGWSTESVDTFEHFDSKICCHETNWFNGDFNLPRLQSTPSLSPFLLESESLQLRPPIQHRSEE